MRDVLMDKFAEFRIRELSGGMKRRVSVAIGIVSDPKVIYLDEPSTGLDPENRRQLWDILGKLRGKRALVLTTHSMEEADVLCNRIAIVNNGILRCVAPQVRLKSLYGGGYQLQINCFKERQLKLQRKMKRRDIRKKKQRDEQSDIKAHPSMIDNSEESTAEEVDFTSISTIHKNVQEFVK